jgi:hypothetical protein
VANRIPAMISEQFGTDYRSRHGRRGTPPSPRARVHLRHRPIVFAIDAVLIAAAMGDPVTVGLASRDQGHLVIVRASYILKVRDGRCLMTLRTPGNGSEVMVISPRRWSLVRSVYAPSAAGGFGCGRPAAAPPVVRELPVARPRRPSERHAVLGNWPPAHNHLHLHSLGAEQVTAIIS